MFGIKSVVLLFLSSATSMASAIAASRDLTVCDTLKACYLVDIETRKEIELTGMDKLTIDPSKRNGYSIRCDVNGKAELDFIKFMYNGITFDEFGLPRYMAGDSNQGAYINKADYLSSCGIKTIKIQGNVWSNPCFEREYVIEVATADGKPCDVTTPVKPPTNAPVKPPTNAPVKPPTIAPVKPPTNAPVKPPTNAPVKPPTKAPVKPPTKAPIKPPTKAPVRPPVPVPVPVPRPVPVPLPVPRPVPVPLPVPRPVPVPVPVPRPVPVPVPVPRPVPVPVPVHRPTPVRSPVCNFVCPINSIPDEHVSCHDTFNDCKCVDGYYKSNDRCVPGCKDEFVCPVNSIPDEHVSCHDSFNDCKCVSGYYKSNGRCVSNCPSGQYWKDGCCKPIPSCPHGQSWIDGRCTTVCKNDYVCPANSYRISNRECYDGFGDCECRYGYYKSDGRCVKHSWCTW